MSPDPAAQRGTVLSPSQVEEIFRTEILPAIGASGDAVENPTFAVVSGQQGAGKSTMIRQIKDGFAGQPTQIVICDDLNAYIPGNNAALMKGNHKVEDRNSFAVSTWYRQLLDRSLDNKYNIILEACHSPEIYAYALETARSRGYRTQLNIVATDKITSVTAIHDRFDKAIKNGFVATTVLPSTDAHSHYYSLWPRVAVDVEKSRNFDSIAIVQRNGKTVYKNEVVTRNDGRQAWKNEPSAMRALMIARNEPLRDPQQRWLKSTWERLSNSRQFALHPDSANVSIPAIRNQVVTALGKQADFNPYKTPVGDQRKPAERFLRGVREDIQLILANKSNRGDFREASFERNFSRTLTAFCDTLEREISEKAAAGFERAQTGRPALGHTSAKRHPPTDDPGVTGDATQEAKRFKTDRFADKRGDRPTIDHSATREQHGGWNLRYQQARPLAERTRQPEKTAHHTQVDQHAHPTAAIGTARGRSDEYGSDPFIGVDLEKLERDARRQRHARATDHASDGEYGSDAFEGANLSQLEHDALQRRHGPRTNTGSDQDYGSDPFEGVDVKQLERDALARIRSRDDRGR
ncbi:zeta toxin family protein [Rhizobium puerariae]|uniref:Zeta toxin family protein n=1 Tax=Rhizobium puerariae TaxID=1585791 RepID=A0ABV6ARB3_9HYPH